MNQWNPKQVNSKALNVFGTASLVAMATFGTALGTAAAQSGSVNSAPAAQASQPAQNADGTYATGKPLEMQSKEGFWGHLNPLARKKWVHRQIDPVADRANELDELQAKNANDIKDVDARATAGVNRAMTAASTADAHAADASNRAGAANATALTADAHTSALNGTVSNLDQYSTVNATNLPFLAGHTTLSAKDKASLGQVASSLASEKGYIVEVEGYSRAGVTSSQAMADSVVRYLVTEQKVPVYRIYRTGLGKVKPVGQASDPTEKPLTNGVRVTVLHNSLASLSSDTNGSNNTSARPSNR